MSERVEGLHSINKQHAVKMVGLVLDNTRGEAVSGKLHWFTITVECTQFHFRRAWYPSP